ncbi:hypothetical protein ABZZ74_24735 [Streptomyces sp. NPDC006476]|uniref:hypothetical protein n=1 Tax=Streptomyces sp. NPDC006476 TaxID=3157175 RepID=UPI0033A125FE
MADDSDVLLELWKEQRDQLRQTENQRAQLTNIVILVVAAGLGFVAQKGLHPSVLVVTMPMTLLGLYGALACLKYRERSALHAAQAQSLRGKLSALHAGLEIEPGWAGTYRDQQAQFPKLFNLRLYVIWLALHVGVAAIGITVTLWALTGS